MTDEQIIQKAREAGMTGEATPAVIEFVRNLLEAEIEACAKVCEQGVQYQHPTVRGHIIKNFGKSELLAKAIRERTQA